MSDNIVSFVDVANKRNAATNASMMQDDRETHEDNLTEFYHRHGRNDVAVFTHLYAAYMSRMVANVSTIPVGAIDYVFASHVSPRHATEQEPNSFSFGYYDAENDVDLMVSRVAVYYIPTTPNLRSRGRAINYKWSEEEAVAASPFVKFINYARENTKQLHPAALIQLLTPLSTASRALYAGTAEEIYMGVLDHVHDPVGAMSANSRFVPINRYYSDVGDNQLFAITLAQLGDNAETLVASFCFDIAAYRHVSQILLTKG